MAHMPTKELGWRRSKGERGCAVPKAVQNAKSHGMRRGQCVRCKNTNADATHEQPQAEEKAWGHVVESPAGDCHCSSTTECPGHIKARCQRADG